MVMQHSSSVLRCTRLHRAIGGGREAHTPRHRAGGQERHGHAGADPRTRRTEMDARLHCSETRAIVEAKCKTIRFDSQRRRCVNMATVQRGCRRRRGDKCEVVPMMKGHMQPRGRSRVTGMLHGSRPARKLHDAWTRRLDGGMAGWRLVGERERERLSLCRHSQCRVYNAMQMLAVPWRLQSLDQSVIQAINR